MDCLLYWFHPCSIYIPQISDTTRSHVMCRCSLTARLYWGASGVSWRMSIVQWWRTLLSGVSLINCSRTLSRQKRCWWTSELPGLNYCLYSTRSTNVGYTYEEVSVFWCTLRMKLKDISVIKVFGARSYVCSEEMVSNSTNHWIQRRHGIKNTLRTAGLYG